MGGGGVMGGREAARGKLAEMQPALIRVRQAAETQRETPYLHAASFRRCWWSLRRG